MPAEPEEAPDEAESEEEIKELEQAEFEALMEKLELSADEMMEIYINQEATQLFRIIKEIGE